MDPIDHVLDGFGAAQIDEQLLAVRGGDLQVVRDDVAVGKDVVAAAAVVVELCVCPFDKSQVVGRLATRDRLDRQRSKAGRRARVDKLNTLAACC